MLTVAVVCGPAALAQAAADPVPAAAQPALPVSPTAQSKDLACAPVADTAKQICVPALTPITIRFEAALSSKTAKTGDAFAFILEEPVIIGGVTAIPAGTRGQGEVVHAKGTGVGVGGELVLAARFLELDSQQIRLRSLRVGVVGGDRQGLAFAVGITVGLPALFIRGKHIEVPEGTLSSAMIAKDVWIASAPTVAAPPASDPAFPTQPTPTPTPTPTEGSTP